MLCDFIWSRRTTYSCTTQSIFCSHLLRLFFLFFNSEARSNQTITMSQVGHHPDSFVQEPDPAYLCPIWWVNYLFLDWILKWKPRFYFDRIFLISVRLRYNIRKGIHKRPEELCSIDEFKLCQVISWRRQSMIFWSSVGNRYIQQNTFHNPRLCSNGARP